MWDVVVRSEIKFDILCGVPYTALPIATAMSLEHNIPMVMRRKEAKDYGTRKIIEGAGYKPGDICLVVEDLVTSGASVSESVKPLAEVGLKVNDVIALVDRQQGGRQLLQEQGVRLHSVFTIREMIDTMLSINKIDQATADSVLNFIASNNMAASKSAAGAAVASAIAQSPKRPTIEAKSLATPNAVTKALFQIMLAKKSNLCVAADAPSSETVLEIADQVGPYVCMLKTHVDTMHTMPSDFGSRLKALADKHGFMIFEDRKFADIGATTQMQFESKVFSMGDWCDMVTAQALPGDGILQAIKLASSKHHTRPNKHGVLLLAHMSSEGNLCDNNYATAVAAMASRHPDVVCGLISQGTVLPHEQGWLHCTPGVKLATGGDGLGQQYVTPQQAIEQGADVIIVGRGITSAKDRAAEADKYRQVGWEIYTNLSQKSPVA
jgi:uridine monophosphate synthetase